MNPKSFHFSSHSPILIFEPPPSLSQISSHSHGHSSSHTATATATTIATRPWPHHRHPQLLKPSLSPTRTATLMPYCLTIAPLSRSLSFLTASLLSSSSFCHSYLGSLGFRTFGIVRVWVPFFSFFTFFFSFLFFFFLRI